jgi:hypothetical protein
MFQLPFRVLLFWVLFAFDFLWELSNLIQFFAGFICFHMGFCGALDFGTTMFILAFFSSGIKSDGFHEHLVQCCWVWGRGFMDDFPYWVFDSITLFLASLRYTECF